MEKVFVHLRDDELEWLCFEELTDAELDREEWIIRRMYYWQIENWLIEFNEEKEEEE